MHGAHHSTRLFAALKSRVVREPARLDGRMKWFDPSRGGMPVDPPFARLLEDDEIEILADWFAETNDIPYCGEVGFQSLSVITTLLLNHRVRNVVQLGHYAGFSSLVIGFILRKIGPDARMISFDIDQALTDYSDGWMRRAGLASQVMHVCADSTDPLTAEMAGACLTGNPQMIFIDASKQYRNTIFEARHWARFTTGFLIAHDVSIVAMGGQANGEKGVSDGLIDAASFAPHELLLLDPHEEQAVNFPFHDEMGLGLGLCRGKEPLPRTGRALEDILRDKRILDSDRLESPENWFLDNQFTVDAGALLKTVGDIGWASTFAPIRSGQTLKFEVELANTNGGSVMVCAGGPPGTGAVISGDGLHRGEFLVGSENSRIAFHGPGDSGFRIVGFRFFQPP